MAMSTASVALTMLVACGVHSPAALPEGTDGIELGTTAAESESGAPEEPGLRLDVGGDETGGPPGGGACPEGGGSSMQTPDFSYIWIANSAEGTVSKIDTETAKEVARYRTGPHGATDDPSRTAVSLEGDVAVTNRGGLEVAHGSVTRIAAIEARCVDLDGDGHIATSSGPSDVLPWGEDECVLWRHEVPSRPVYSVGPRPTAWDVGEDRCTFADDRVWVGWYDDDAEIGEFRRLDGATGTLLDEVHVPGWVPLRKDHGPYGGAVDGNNDLWVIGLAGPLVRIDARSLEHTRWEVPTDTSPYGIALDAEGRPWLAGQLGDISRFDPPSQTWAVFHVEADAPTRLRGLQVDRDGMLWAARNEPCGLVQFDTVAVAFVDALVALPDCEQPVGVSVDAAGRVWVPDRDRDRAYRVDPATHDVVFVDGLVSPYTYSDMTGAGLALAFTPPEG